MTGFEEKTDDMAKNKSTPAARTLASASEVWEPKFLPDHLRPKGFMDVFGSFGCRTKAGSLSTLLGFDVVLESWDITDVPTSDGGENATLTTTTVSTTFTYSTTSSTIDPNSTTVAASAMTGRRVFNLS